MPAEPAALSDAVVGRAVRHLRTEAGLSLEALAERSHVGDQIISRIERGVRPCRVVELDLLARAAGSTLDEAVQVAGNLSSSRNSTRSRAQLAGPAAAGPAVDDQPCSPAVLAVDVQRAFLTTGTPDGLALRIGAFIDELAATCVVATQYTNTPGAPARKLLGWSGAARPEEVELDPAVAERATQILVKHTYGLDTVPATLLGRRVYVVGLDTDVCVHAVVTQLFDAGVDVQVVADLCGSSGGAGAHAAGLVALSRVVGAGRVIDSGRALRKGAAR